MLLVKSKELKNSNKILFKTKGLAALCASLLGFFVPAALAQSNTSYSSLSQIASIFFSLLFVIAIIFGLAYLMRRFNVTHATKGEMHVVASMMAGTKERIMVLQVGQEQHLIGVTATQISHLAKLETPLDTEADNTGSFKDKLALAMAQKINPNVGGDKS